MKKYLLQSAKIGAAVGAAIFAASTAQGQYNNSPAPTVPAAPPAETISSGISHADKEFIEFASQANQTEIAMADIADSRSQNSDIKDFARMMRTDHQGNLAQLQTIAQKYSVVLDPSLDMMNKHAVNHLQKVDAADFDKDYAKVMLKDHVKVITKFDKALEDVSQPDLKQYAENTLPALRKHLHHAENTAHSVGLDQDTISSILKGLPAGEENRAVSFNNR